MLKPADLGCPYLSFDGGLAGCMVRDEPWFLRTSCHRDGDRALQREAASSAACSLGTLVRSIPALQGALLHAPRASLEALPELGPWEADWSAVERAATAIVSQGGRR